MEILWNTTNAESQMQDTTTYLPDTDRSCGSCKGKKYTEEHTERGTTLYEPCYACGGSGANSIRVGGALK